MVSESAPRRATYQDVLDAAPDQVAEIIDGELYLSPRPGAPHVVVTSELGIDLGMAFGRGRGGPGGWILLDEPELHLDGHVMVPDMAGWRRERLPVVEDDAFFTLAPDWLCEALSPSTEKIDRIKKLPRYAAGGVNHVWLINAKQRTLEVLRRVDTMWLLIAVHHDDDKVRAEPFDAIELDLAVLWARIGTSGQPTRAGEAIAVYAAAAAEHAG